MDAVIPSSVIVTRETLPSERFIWIMRPMKFIAAFCLLAQLSFGQELTVGAAASLKPALEKITTLDSSVKPTFTFGSSGTLQKQIENGAPIDVFISAALSQMEALDKKGLIASATRTNFLGNKLVLIAPKASSRPANLQDLKAAEIRHIAMGEPKSVPAGQYAAQALQHLDLLEVLQPKAVYGADVRQVLTYVERGDAEAGIVYQSDAQSSDKVRLVTVIPPETHSPIIYAAAIVKDAKHEAAAAAFLRLLTSPEARKIFLELGFTPASERR